MPSQRQLLLPDWYDRLLCGLAIILLSAVIIAVGKGYSQWAEIPGIVWAHLATISFALMLTPVMLMRRRGDRTHRVLGWLWCGAMFTTALISFSIRQIGSGGFSYIHLLSLLTVFLVPLLIWEARSRKIKAHRSTVRGLTTGALLIAGFFTFPFGRLLGDWLFG